MDPSLSYDYFVMQDAGLMHRARGHNEDWADAYAHQYWRRLIDGYALGDILADMGQRSDEVAVIGGWGVWPVDAPPEGLTYDGFLAEQHELAEVIAEFHGGWTPQDLAHNAWRRLVERGVWTQANLIHDIKGEPLEPVAPEPGPAPPAAARGPSSG